MIIECSKQILLYESHDKFICIKCIDFSYDHCMIIQKQMTSEANDHMITVWSLKQPSLQSNIEPELLHSPVSGDGRIAHPGPP